MYEIDDKTRTKTSNINTYYKFYITPLKTIQIFNLWGKLIPPIFYSRSIKPIVK